MKKAFKIYVKPTPLTIEEIAAKYSLRKDDLAKIRTFVFDQKGLSKSKVSKSRHRATRMTTLRKKAAR